MSLLAALAATAGSGTPVDPGTPTTDPLDTTPGTLPYAHRTTAPWNAPVPAITPTPDGTGSAVHPDVIDFGPGNLWHGWRFWMGVTPYFGGNAGQENPLILVSADGFTWQAPSGGTPAFSFTALPEQSGSDTDLVYDPDGDRLILTWREYVLEPPVERIYGASSTDGVTWGARTLLWTVTGPTDAETASQAVVRVGAGDWRAWARNKPTDSNGGLTVRTATNPLGTWSAPVQCVTPLAPAGGERFWHLDVIRHGGRFLALLNYTDLRPAVSTDGINWTEGPGFLLPRSGGWDDRNMYRGTIQPHVDGTHMRVWYSSDSTNDAQSWRVGYTLVPMSLWNL